MEIVNRKWKVQELFCNQTLRKWSDKLWGKDSSTWPENKEFGGLIQHQGEMLS